MSFVLYLVASLCAALPATAEMAATSEPTTSTKALLAGMQAASGGVVWNNVRTLHFTFEIAAHGMQGASDVWQDVRSGRYHETTVWPAYTEQDGFDGITPWHQGRSGIAYALGDPDAARGAADEAFRVARAYWFPGRHAAAIAYDGIRREAKRQFERLEISPEGGRPFRVLIDKHTHLLARTEEQQAEDYVVTNYTNYRPVHGLMLPCTIRYGDGVHPDDDEIWTVRHVEIDAPLADSDYTLPRLPPSDTEFPAHQDSVEVPFRLTADNKIIVPVSINGRDVVSAEFDSGGSLVLQPATLARLGIDSSGHSAQGGGGEGTITASNGRLASIALGGATVRNVAFHSFAFRKSQPELAIVGLETLQRFAVRIDFDGNMLTLTRPDAFVYHGNGAAIPFHFQDNQPEIEGSIDGIAGRFTIDTGDSGSLLLLAPFAERYDLVRRYHADLPYQGVAVSATHGVWARQRVSTVALDGPDGRPIATVHEPVTRISLQHSGFDADRDVSANIGLGILKQFNIVFDYRRQTLILEPNHFYGRKDVFNRAGLRLERRENHWVITTIYPGTPAADAGLNPGDVILRLNGGSPASLDDDAIWAKLEGPVGETLKLMRQIPGGKQVISLTLRDLL